MRLNLIQSPVTGVVSQSPSGVIPEQRRRDVFLGGCGSVGLQPQPIVPFGICGLGSHWLVKLLLHSGSDTEEQETPRQGGLPATKKLLLGILL